MTVLQYHRLPVLAHQHRLSFRLFVELVLSCIVLGLAPKVLELFHHYGTVCFVTIATMQGKGHSFVLIGQCLGAREVSIADPFCGN
jgi:hypothetical protein